LLHSLIYPAAMLAILHFLWLSKVIRDPLIYGVIVAVLLIIRLPPVRSRLMALRKPTRRATPGQREVLPE
jgi:sulfoxide reductase heme-binding subunit YedZ